MLSDCVPVTILIDGFSRSDRLFPEFYDFYSFLSYLYGVSLIYDSTSCQLSSIAIEQQWIVYHKTRQLQAIKGE